MPDETLHVSVTTECIETKFKLILWLLSMIIFSKPFFSLFAILNYDKLKELCHSFQVFVFLEVLNFEPFTWVKTIFSY